MVKKLNHDHRKWYGKDFSLKRNTIENRSWLYSDELEKSNNDFHNTPNFEKGGKNKWIQDIG